MKSLEQKIKDATTLTDVECPHCEAEIYVEVIARDHYRRLNACPLCGTQLFVYCYLTVKELEEWEKR